MNAYPETPRGLSDPVRTKDEAMADLIAKGVKIGRIETIAQLEIWAADPSLPVFLRRCYQSCADTLRREFA